MARDRNTDDAQALRELELMPGRLAVQLTQSFEDAASPPRCSRTSTAFASSAASIMSCGTGTKIRLPIHADHAQAASTAGTPQTTPIRMTMPRSTLSSPAAATGPGCGGRKAWVIDRPASSGRQ